MGGWQTIGGLLAVLTPLLGVPLTAIMFYLKGLREHQVSRYADLLRRADAMEAAAQRLDRAVSEIGRDATTKEEWLRECMWARGQIERLTAAMARAEAALDGMATLPATVERTGRLVASIAERVSVAPAVDGDEDSV